MMRRNPLNGRALILLPVAVGLFMTSCRSVNTVQREEPVARPDPVDAEQIKTDPSLGRNVEVVEVHQAETGAGFLQVQVEVANRTRSAKGFSYSFDWFDENGILLREGQFTHRRIQGGQRMSITDVAPTSKAKDFRLHLIESR